MRALFSGVTGLRAHQLRMDVIGNNIANVNTTGFKSSRVSFMDVFSQTMSNGSTDQNPQQVGLGVGVASTDLNMSAGSMQMTGRALDLGIEGNGFFIVKDSNGTLQYTRAGNFDWSSQGYLVVPGTGQRVQGWQVDAKGNPIGNPTDIQVQKGSTIVATPTANIGFSKNLDANMAIAAGNPPSPSYSTAVTVYDSLGRAQSLTFTFTKTGPLQWQWDLTTPAGITVNNPTGTLDFLQDGTMDPASAGRTAAITLQYTAGDAQDQDITIDFSKITQAYATSSGSTVQATSADGNPMGVLESVYVDTSGVVTAVYSNGTRAAVGVLALADFANPAGLLKAGSSSFVESGASGTALVGRPGAGGLGKLVPQNLEMSNVDLATEFTNMIMTQRGFQANTRIITTADEMLQDVVNLRR